MTAYLTFRVADGQYAVPLARMREIVPLPPLTRVPTTSPMMRGLFNRIGQIVPVLDVSMHLGFGETAVDARSCVAIAEVPLNGEPVTLGVLVGEIGDVVELSAADPIFRLLDLEQLVTSLAAPFAGRLAVHSVQEAICR